MTRPEATSVACLLVFVLLFSLSYSTIPVLAAPIRPTVSMEQPLYTRWNREAYLEGSGFGAGTYYLWMRPPDKNSTSYLGISFQPAADGSVPSGTKIPIGVEYPLGTYRVSVSTSSTSDTSLVQCHFGLWGTEKSVYQRTEMVRIVGGGTWPGSGVKLIVRSPLGSFVFNSTVAADMNGTFLSEYRIPNSAVTESYDIFVDGTGTYDDAKQDYFHKTGFTVIAATLSISVYAKPQKTYQRTESAIIDFLVRYPDNSPVASIREGTAPVILMDGPIVVAQIAPTLIDSVNGVWRASWEAPRNATLGVEYRFEMAGQAFDDGFRNLGGSDRIITNLFEIVPASLTIKAETNRSTYQVAFDSIRIKALVTYPNGKALSDGKVSVRMIHGLMNETIQMTYDSPTASWHAIRPLSLLELSQIGTWVLVIEATDDLGNGGAESLEVDVQPWFMVLAIAGLVVIIFVVTRGLQWFRRKHLKKLRGWAKNLRIPFRKPQSTY